MPGETVSDMTEQQVSAVEEDLLKQSKSDLPGNELSNESTYFPFESTNHLKRPLPDEADGDKKKKIRLTNISEDELEVTNKCSSEKNHIELLIQKVAESIENTLGEKESNVSNKTHLNNETNTSSNVINHNGDNGIDDNNCKKNYPGKNTFSKNISKDREVKTNSTNNVNNNCEFNGNSEDIVKNDKQTSAEKDIITTKGILYSNRSSASDNLVSIENSDEENENIAVVDDFRSKENISKVVNNSTVTKTNPNSKISEIENIVNRKQNGTDKFKTKKKRHPCNNNTKNTEVVGSTGSHQDLEVIDSDTDSDISSSDLPDLPEDINDIITGAQQITKESFPKLLKLFSKKELTYEQFDSFCTQKMIEMMTEKLYWGKERSELQLLKEREKHWRAKYFSLNRQFKEIKTIVNVHKLDLKTNEHARPHLITRTVGLQAVLCPKKDGNIKLPKLAIPSSKPDTNPVSVISDEEDDGIALNAKETTSSSTSNIENTTPKKQKSPILVTSKSPVLSPKIVTAVKPLNPIKIGTTTTIDLTGNDDVVEVSNKINLEKPKSPFKVIHRRSPGILPAQLNGNLPKTFAYVELPKIATSSSSFIVRTASGSPQRTTVSNKDNINTIDPKLKNLKPYLIDVSRVDPVLVQPCTVAYTAQRVPVSQISGTLQPLSTAPAPYTPRQITVSQLSASLKQLTPTVYTTCHVPVSRISGSLSQASPGTAFTACRLPISIRTIPSLSSNEHSLTRSQPARPPPPAIPLLQHPARLPDIPNQRSLISWKKIPPAPKLGISRTVESANPQALVLSWTMNNMNNRTVAEVACYQIFAYQETPNEPPKTELWKKIGEVNALPLPMACSLTQFSNGEKYHFAVRAVDVHSRVGPFSLPQSSI